MSGVMGRGQLMAASGLVGAVCASACMKCCWRCSERRRGVVPAADVAKVIRFWFEEEDTPKLQHRLWFCPEGSALQKQVDDFITRTFGHLILLVASGAWVPDPSDPRALLAFVIVADQFSRHYYRKISDGKQRVPAAVDEAALKASKCLLDLDEAWRVLSPPQLVFALLPLRHHKSSIDAEKACHRRALDHLAAVEKLVKEQEAVCNRFRTATVRRFQALCDVKTPGEGILEKEEFTPSPDVAAGRPRETLVRTTARFLLNRGGDVAGSGAVCVSLSGGVDSMVIADILVHLRDHPKPVERARKGQYTGIADRRVKHNKLETQTAGLVRKVVAVHINYSNRAEADDEAAFLRDWCARRRIVYREKKISDIKRADASRDEYEEITKGIRFDAYRAAAADEGTGGVCLGHHAGDVVENLLSNATKGCGLLSLSGMADVAEQHGVAVWRPLLTHDKDEIFAYAHLYGVPYFKDTTPTWSTRGKLRRQLLPVLADTYGDGSVQNLHALAVESDALKRLVECELVGPYFEARVGRRPLGVRVELRGYKRHGRIFWKEVFKTIQHRVFDTAMLSETGLREVAARLALTNFEDDDENYVLPAQLGWIEPKKGMFWYLEDADHLFIPHPGIFDAGFNGAGRDPMTVPETRVVGCWTVSTAWYDVPEEEEGDGRCNDHRALPKPCRAAPIPSWDALFSGTFTYCFVVPDGALPLLWQDSEAAALPWCWKQMHPRFLQSLPIPSAAPLRGDSFRTAKVTYTYTPP